MISSTTLIIGTVSGVSGSNARILPLRTHNGDSWTPARSEDFPPNGSVFWERARPQIARGDVIAFHVRRHFGQNDWAVEREVDCHRLIDYTSRGYELVLRNWHQGPLVFGREAGPRSVYLACRENIVLGPLKAHAENRKLTLDPTQRLDRIEANHCPEAIVNLGQHGLWMIPQLRENPSNVVDARTDVEVLRSAMSDARKILGDQDESVPAIVETKSAIATALKLVAAADIDRTKIERLERAMAIVEQWEGTRLRATDLEREIQALPDTVAIIDRLRAAVATDVRATAEAEFARENAAAEAGLASARAEITELEAQASTLRDELSRADDLVQQRLAEISSDAAKAVSESIMLSALTQTNASLYSTPQSASARRQLRTGRPFTATDVDVPTKPVAAFSEAAADDSLEALRRIHAAITAGLVPVLLGSGARQALSTYARIAMAGRTVSLPVAHDFLQPVDLLGIVAETGALARPHGDLLVSANREVSTKYPGLVVLEGFNRGATESYLVPWLSEPNQSIQIELEAREALGEQHFTRHPRLAVAAIATVGATSARVGPELWSGAVLIDVPTWRPSGQNAPALSRTVINAHPSPTAVEVAKNASTGSVEIAKQWWQIDAGVLDAAERFAAALADVRGKKGDTALIRQALAECSLLPPVATEADPAELRDAVAAIAQWAAPGDDDYEQRLIRRAHRAARALG